MDEITLHGGILGTRKLAAAYATVLLRKRGLLRDDGLPAIAGKRYVPLGARQRRPWHPIELTRAQSMRERGVSVAAIAAALNRTEKSIYFKIRRSA